tara:strand:+ start:95 stop:331 length:237 start_codon:yes stop_codon:yes gene_type:complete
VNKGSISKNSLKFLIWINLGDITLKRLKIPSRKLTYIRVFSIWYLEQNTAINANFIRSVHTKREIGSFGDLKVINTLN